MLLVGRWSPSKRSFHMRMFGRKRTTIAKPAPREAQMFPVVDLKELARIGTIVLADE